MGQIGELWVRIGAKIDDLEKGLSDVDKSMKKVGDKMAKVGKTLTKYVTLPLAGIGVAAIKMSMDFNKAMAEVSTLLDGDIKRVQELKKNVQDLAVDTGKSTNDIARGLYEVVSAFASIANGGTLYKPKVVKEIVDSEKNLIREIKPEVLRQGFVNPENIQIVKEGMRKAVTGEGAPHASSVLLNSLPVTSAAKTGTAQTPKTDYYHNWISVFAPYEEPEIVLTILVEDVKEAQVVALPIAREILQWYFSR